MKAQRREFTLADTNNKLFSEKQHSTITVAIPQTKHFKNLEI